MRFYHFAICMMCAVCACTKESPKEAVDMLSMAEEYKDYFPIGVALSPKSLSKEDTLLIQSEFNSITAENVMKMGPIHPEQDRYDWEQSDRLVDFATDHGMRIRGHALCWHEQTPDWFFWNEDSTQVSKEVLLERLKEHITTVVSRYKGRIYAWDVVNEAVADDSTKLLRESLFYKITGDEFIVKAFEFAHEADPETLLFYNDYNADWPEKRDRIFKLIKGLKDRGVPIDGIGLQGHWSINNPTDGELKTALEKYASLGVKVQITELDISIYPWEKERRDKRPDEDDKLDPIVAEHQLKRYQSLFEIFREKKDVISGVTFWGLTDAHSWLGNYPVKGRRNYPLLFDHDGNRKEVYHAVVGFAND